MRSRGMRQRLNGKKASKVKQGPGQFPLLDCLWSVKGGITGIRRGMLDCPAIAVEFRKVRPDSRQQSTSSDSNFSICPIDSLPLYLYIRALRLFQFEKRLFLKTSHINSYFHPKPLLPLYPSALAACPKDAHCSPVGLCSWQHSQSCQCYRDTRI